MIRPSWSPTVTDMSHQPSPQERMPRSRHIRAYSSSRSSTAAGMAASEWLIRYVQSAEDREAIAVGEQIVSTDRRQIDCRLRAPGPTYFALGRTRTPSFFCSRTCADQPAVREHANIAGASGGGISATSSTIADQNSTFVYE